MKRLLIISPHFPPINSADSQRVRMSLPHYEKYGWKADILCIDPENDSGVLDHDLVNTVPEKTDVFRTRIIPESVTKFAGVKGVQWRSLYGLYKHGSELIKKNSYDLVFFSSTVFPTFILGPLWKKKFGIPYVIDIQDPWLNDYQYENPPGGKIKYFLSNLFARIFEPLVVKSASQILFVSRGYPKLYKKRYGILDDFYTVLPFGFSKNDFDVADSMGITGRFEKTQDQKENWVYMGRAGEDYLTALDLFFRAIKRDLDEGLSRWDNVKLNFIGTSYAERGRAVETVKPVADTYGLGDMVDECTERIPFLETLKMLQKSDVIMMFGSDDSTYSPSKIYPYVYSGRPVFALLHSLSPGFEILKELGCGFITGFSTEADAGETVDKIRGIFGKLFETIDGGLDFRNEHINNYEASGLTKIQCEIFDKCIDG